MVVNNMLVTYMLTLYVGAELNYLHKGKNTTNIGAWFLKITMKNETVFSTVKIYT
jgi:hypothetical protein